MGCGQKAFFCLEQCVILTTGNVPFYRKGQANHKEKEKIMTVLYIILLAIVQGITEFLAGQQFRASLFCAESSWYGARTRVSCSRAMLHLGTLAAIFMTFQKDIRHLAFEALDMFMDLIGNANLYIHNRRTGEQLHYAQHYQQYISEICSSAPCIYDSDGISGLHCKTGWLAVSATSVLIPGAGIMVTGILLAGY